jgi:maltose-binding protein MalE
MKIKIRLSILIVIICLILGLFSCQSPIEKKVNNAELLPSATPTRIMPTSPIPTATQKTLHGTISIRHGWDEKQIPALVQIIKEFQNQYPDVYFDVLYVPNQDLKTRYENEVIAGKGPSILLGAAEWGPDLYQAGLVMNFEEHFSKNNLEYMNEAALQATRLQENLIGIPYTINGVVLYRNKDIITIAQNTFEDLIMIAQSSTQGDTIGAFLERSFFYSGAHLNGLGGSWMDEQGLPTFNNPTGVAWLELLDKFREAGPVNYFTDEDIELFKTGAIGWIIDGTWNLFELANTIGIDNLTIDPFPSYKNGRLSGFVRSENIYLNPNIQESNLEAAIAFAEFLVSQDAQKMIAQTGKIPAITNITLNGTDDTKELELISYAINALSEGIAYPVHPNMSIYNIQMDISLRSFFEEEIPAEEILTRAEDAILLELSEKTENPTTEP